jgi:hypothetical protein
MACAIGWDFRSTPEIELVMMKSSRSVSRLPYEDERVEAIREFRGSVVRCRVVKSRPSIRSVIIIKRIKSLPQRGQRR